MGAVVEPEPPRARAASWRRPSASPRLSGLYLVAAAAFVVAGLCSWRLSRAARCRPSARRRVTRSELSAGLGSARVALIVLGATNLVMVGVMAIAPVHLTEHGHSLDFVGVVIGIHVLCMFAPSPLTGWLADRAGSARGGCPRSRAPRRRGRHAVPCWTCPTAALMTAMLVLLGLGWNAGVVGGSTMLAASVPAALRPQTEGIGEVAMGLAAGAGAPAAGLIVAFGDFTTLSIAVAIGALLLLAALRLPGPKVATATIATHR